MDVFSKEERSKVMRAVKSNKNKSTELKLIEIFRQYGLKGWRRNYKVFGKPDFVFHKYKIAVFVDGCFWHGHDCRNTKPASNKDYWDEKIDRNIKRDKKVNSHLTNLGWKVIRIWECEIKKKPLDAANKIKKAVNIF
jgi:DNA mismatch endonuclease (patch repair protein)